MGQRVNFVKGKALDGMLYVNKHTLPQKLRGLLSP